MPLQLIFLNVVENLTVFFRHIEGLADEVWNRISQNILRELIDNILSIYNQMIAYDAVNQMETDRSIAI